MSLLDQETPLAQSMQRYHVCPLGGLGSHDRYVHCCMKHIDMTACTRLIVCYGGTSRVKRNRPRPSKTATVPSTPATAPPLYLQVRLAAVANDQSRNTRRPMEHGHRDGTAKPRLPKIMAGNLHKPVHAYVPAEDRRAVVAGVLGKRLGMRRCV
eukprot:3124462-Amphidinium_carterae.1